jgi:hypothetical protein
MVARTPVRILRRRSRRTEISKSQARLHVAIAKRAAQKRYDERADRRTHPVHDRSLVRATNAVRVYPPDIVKRRTVAWDGKVAETVQTIGPEKIEFRFRAPIYSSGI